MIRKATIENIILKFKGNFTAKNILNKNKILFDQSYNQKKSLNYITVVLHILWKEQKIKKVNRGIFTNNQEYIEVNFKDWNSVIDFYCKNDNGFVAKEFLWNKYNLITKWPTKLLIYSNLIKRTKKHDNIEVRPTKIAINSHTRYIFELFELIQIVDFRKELHYNIIDMFIKQHNLKFNEIKAYNKFFIRRFNKLIKNYEFK